MNIHIKVTLNEDGGKEIEASYPEDVKLPDILLALEETKKHVIQIFYKYLTENGIEKDSEIDVVYYELELKNMV